MKKLYGMAATLLMIVLLLIGCSTNPANTDPTTNDQDESSKDTVGSTQNPTENTDATRDDINWPTLPPVSFEEGMEDDNPPFTIARQDLPAVVDNPDNLPVLKWVCLAEDYTYGNRRWSEDAVHEVNQMLADKDMPFRVQLIMITAKSQYAVFVKDWTAFPEVTASFEEADLIFGPMTRDAVLKYLSPITDYVAGDSQPTLKDAVPHELNWFSTTIDGEIYGIDTTPERAVSTGWQVDNDFIKRYKLSEQDFSRNFWEMDELFEKVYKLNGNQPFLCCEVDGVVRANGSNGIIIAHPSGGIRDAIDFAEYQHIGACFGIDLSAEDPTIVNVLETEYVRKIQEAVARYKAAGYVLENQGAAAVQYTRTVGSTPYAVGGKICVPVTGSLARGFENAETITGVAAGSEYKGQAIDLLNLIAEDEEFRLQLFYGKEGRDYKIENGYFTLITRDDGTNYSLDMISPLSYFCGYVSDPSATTRTLCPGTNPYIYLSYNGKTPLESYRDNMDGINYRYYPVCFDYSGLLQELENLGEVMGIYYPIFTNSTYMNDARYEQMLQEMKDAGSDKIISELQKQLDAWVADNPNW